MKDKELMEKLNQLSEMDAIFKKISDKYKNKNDEYLTEKKLDDIAKETISKKKELMDEIEKGIYFTYDYRGNSSFIK